MERDGDNVGDICCMMIIMCTLSRHLSIYALYVVIVIHSCASLFACAWARAMCTRKLCAEPPTGEMNVSIDERPIFRNSHDSGATKPVLKR